MAPSAEFERYVSRYAVSIPTQTKSLLPAEFRTLVFTRSFMHNHALKKTLKEA